jgi:hypothetical protein
MKKTLKKYNLIFKEWQVKDELHLLLQIGDLMEAEVTVDSEGTKLDCIKGMLEVAMREIEQDIYKLKTKAK